MLRKGQSDQARQPTGFVGRLMGEVMGATNRARNTWLLQQLDLRPELTGLEFGFGSGETLQRFLDRCSTGTALGIDWSSAMVDTAARRNRAEIALGRLELRLGSITDPGLDLGRQFDRIWSSNVIQMVPDRPALFSALRPALTDIGVLAVCFQRRRDAPSARTLAPLCERELIASGYSDIETRWMPDGSEPAFCILAR